MAGLFEGLEAVPRDRCPRWNSFDLVEVCLVLVLAVVLDDALTGVHNEYEGRVDEGEEEVEDEAHEEKLADFEPL